MTQESWAPSLSPVAASSAVVPPTSAPTVLPNNFTANNPNEIPMINFILYLFMCMVVLIGLVFCNQRQAAAARSGAQNATTTNSQQQVDAVKGMTPEERKAYVTNFLKTQKFVNIENPGSFRVTQASSFRIPSSESDKDMNDPSESNHLSVPCCAICLDPFLAGEDVCSAQNALCPHEFHLTCIFPWLLKSQDCPCCRRDYLSPIEETDATTTAALPSDEVTPSERARSQSM